MTLRHPAITALALLAGCAGSLADRIDEAPAGSYGAGLCSPLGTEALPAPAPPQLAVPEGASAVPVGQAEDHIGSGAVRAEDLAAAGLDLGDRLTEVQGADWRAPAVLDRDAARLVFLARSPAVRAAVQRYRSSFSRYGQVEWLNDLVKQYDAFAEELSRTGVMGSGMGAMGPGWPLQGPGRLQSVIVDADVARARARLEMDVLAALVTFEAAFQEAVYWDRAARILARDEGIAEQVVGAARSLYAGGRGGYADVLMGEMRKDELSERRRTAAERAAAERLALGATLDVPPGALDGTRLGASKSLPALPGRDATRSLAQEEAPSVRMAGAMAERAALMVQLVERQLLPELSPGTAFDRAARIPRRPADVGYATRAPFLAELRLMREAEEAAHDQARRSSPAAADGRWVMLSEALRMQRLLAGPQRSRARQALDAAMESYQADRTTFATVNQALSLLLDVELAAERMRKEAFVATAELLRATGTGRAARRLPGEQGPGGANR